MSQLPPDVDAAVRGEFKVVDSFLLPEDEVEYKVVYDQSSKQRFKELWAELNSKGYTPRLQGSREEATLIIRRKQPPKVSGSRIPAFLLFLTLAVIVAFSLLQGLVDQLLAPQVPLYLVVVSYSVCVAAVIAAYEAGCRYASERAGVTPATSYLVPGVPAITAFLPALGIVSSQREPAVNRDSLFDITLAGPVAALALVLIVYVAGEFSWIQSSVTLQSLQTANSFIQPKQLNPSVVQWAIDSVLSPFTRTTPAGYVRISPLLDAATVGFFLMALNLLPTSLFGGGRLLTAAFGDRLLRPATILSAVGLAVIDTPNYLFIALFLILMAGRNTNLQTLDEVSEPSVSRKALFLVALVVALLLIPIPQNIFGLS